VWLVSRWLLAVLPAGLSAAGHTTAAAGFDQTHALYAGVLRNFVTNGLVDYARLKAAPGELDAYLNEVAAVTPEDFVAWSRDNRLALLLNLYNARTLRLIIDHYPLKSIRDIGVLGGAAWRELVVRFGGQIMSLDHLENNVIRPEYREPRVHFALVCAARGCPPLRAEPYLGGRLSEQLDDQARRFLAEAEKNRFDAATDTLWLSPIFKWYKDDFTGGGGSLADYVKPFLSGEPAQTLSNSARVKVRYTKYDWELNERKR
jgi:hypothetical protein